MREHEEEVHEVPKERGEVADSTLPAAQLRAGERR